MTAEAAVRSAQRVIEGVAAHGVRYIFGIPGAKADTAEVTDPGIIAAPTGARITAAAPVGAQLHEDLFA